VFHSESQASAFIRSRIAKGTVVHADAAGSWDSLHEGFEVKGINHQEAYSLDGACTNWAEEYFSRLRRAEVGIHHYIAGADLLRYAQESSWREDNRRVSNGAGVEARQVGGLYRLRLERFRAKWIPVRVKKTRQTKRLEPGSDSIRTDKALAACRGLTTLRRLQQRLRPSPATSRRPSLCSQLNIQDGQLIGKIGWLPLRGD
jgi:ISXO2-like transposase domain